MHRLCTLSGKPNNSMLQSRDNRDSGIAFGYLLASQ